VLAQAAQERPGLAGKFRYRAGEERASPGKKPVCGFQEVAVLSQQAFQPPERPRSRGSHRSRQALFTFLIGEMRLKCGSQGLQQPHRLVRTGGGGLQLIEEVAHVGVLVQQLRSTLIAGRFEHGLPPGERGSAASPAACCKRRPAGMNTL
jgi:hypothetical protein